MTDVPMIFSTEMVQALVQEVCSQGAGKTMTRRLAWAERFYKRADRIPCGLGARSVEGGFMSKRKSPWQHLKAGDRLWVREDWRVSGNYDHLRPSELPARKMTVLFAAGGSIANVNVRGNWKPDLSYPPFGAPFPEWIGKARSARFLPGWASRLTLIVEAVKFERLQDVTENDARDEGAYRNHDVRWPDGDPGTIHDVRRRNFAAIWERIHGLGSWAENPEVVAIRFRPVLANIEHLSVSF